MPLLSDAAVPYDVLFIIEFIVSASCAFTFALAYAMMLVFWGEFYWFEEGEREGEG
jgi:hypothetical protein